MNNFAAPIIFAPLSVIMHYTFYNISKLSKVSIQYLQMLSSVWGAGKYEISKYLEI